MTSKRFIELVAEHKGKHLPFDQGALIDGRAYIDEGACSAFSAIWIRHKKLKAAGQPQPGKQACMEEVSWIKEQIFKGNGAVFNDYFQGNGLRSEGGIRWPADLKVSFTKLWFFLQSNPAYYLVNLFKDKKTGHGIAFDTTNGQFILFDPNYGSARFATMDTLKEFFGTYWLEAYPSLRGHGSILRFK